MNWHQKHFCCFFCFLILINSIESPVLKHYALGVQKCTSAPETFKYSESMTMHLNNFTHTKKEYCESLVEWTINPEKPLTTYLLGLLEGSNSIT